MGSARIVADDSSDADSFQSYAPYDEPVEPGTFGSPFMFTGEMVDANELVYLRARYYAPELGAFTRLDPVEGSVGQAMSLNRYGYVAGNVVNMVDPSGQIIESPAMWDSCAQPEDNCLLRCVLENYEWVRLYGEINGMPPEDITRDKANAFFESFHQYYECVQNCDVIYIGNTPYLVTPFIPTFANSEYPPQCQGTFSNAETCMSGQLSFLANTDTMIYLHNMYTELDNRAGMELGTEKLILFGSFVAPDKLWKEYHPEGTPGDVKDFYEYYQEKTDEGWCVTLYGKRYGRDVPGNIIFGYLAHQAGFTSFASLVSAGIAQFLDDITSGSQISSVNPLSDFGDSPEDQVAIQMGLDLYNLCGDSQCTDENFIQVLESYRAEYIQAARASKRAECRPNS